jgi:hypothetical protein
MGHIPVNLPHINPICLGTVRHESFENDIGNTILQHDIIEIFPKNDLGPSILRLHITKCHCENLAMFAIVDMTCHCSPFSQTLHMVKRDPRIFHVSSILHALHQINFASSKIHKHLEHKDLIFGLPWSGQGETSRKHT